MTRPSLLALAVVFIAVGTRCSRSRAGRAEVPPGVAAGGPALEGRVTDDAGRPIAGAKVILWGGLATRLRGEETSTDADGRYRFAPLKTGALILDEPSGRWDFHTGMTLEHPDFASADGESWWEVRVTGTEGQVTRRDFKMLRGGSIEGHVTATTGGPAVAGLDLRLVHAKTGFLRYVRTDREGRFRESGLHPGEYKIDVNDPALRYPVMATVEVKAGAVAKCEAVHGGRR